MRLPKSAPFRYTVEDTQRGEWWPQFTLIRNWFFSQLLYKIYLPIAPCRKVHLQPRFINSASRSPYLSTDRQTVFLFPHSLLEIWGAYLNMNIANFLFPTPSYLNFILVVLLMCIFNGKPSQRTIYCTVHCQWFNKNLQLEISDIIILPPRTVRADNISNILNLVGINK